MSLSSDLAAFSRKPGTRSMSDNRMYTEKQTDMTHKTKYILPTCPVLKKPSSALRHPFAGLTETPAKVLHHH